MPFDLRLIESFVAVAETLSFSAAAQRTNTVQSAVSTHIKTLEQQVGRSLVRRGRGQPVVLTAEGAAFLVQARRLLMLADQMLRAPGSTPEAEPLRLGTTVTFALSVVPAALSAFAAGADAVPVTVRTARSHHLMDLLEGGQIDAALVFDQGAHPMRQETVQAALAWVAAEGFVPPAGAPLPLAFLDDARDLRRHAYSALDDAGTMETTLTTHPDPIGLRAVLSAGLAVSILPRLAIVAPLAEVATEVGLPKLGAMPVSIYARAGARGEDLQRLAHAVVGALPAG